MILIALDGILYLLATVLIGLKLFDKLSGRRAIIFYVAYPAVILHAYLLFNWIDTPAGQNLAFFPMFSFITWLVAALIMGLTIWQPVEYLGVISFPLAAMSLLLIVLFPQQQLVNTANHPRELIHILLAALTFSIILLAGIQAVLLALAERLLRRHGTKINLTLPSLQTLEVILFRFIQLGFFALSLMIITSWHFLITSFNPAVLQKTILVILTWIILGILLVGRYHYGWRGRKAIYGTLLGVGLLILIYFGSILLIELLL